MIETFYIKKGKRYISVGLSGPDIYDGLWLVQSKPGCKSYKNLYMRIADLPNCHDLTILAKTAMLEDIIARIMLKSWSNNASSSIQTVAGLIAAEITTTEAKLTQKQLRTGL